MAEFWGNLTADVHLDGVELGQEFFIRARVVTLEEETIDITSMGREPRVVGGMNRAKLMPLGVVYTMPDLSQGTDPASSSYGPDAGLEFPDGGGEPETKEA